MSKFSKSAFILVLLWSIHSGLGAQQVTLSQEIHATSNERFILIGQVSDTILLFNQSNFEYSLHVFSKELELLFEKELFFERQRIRLNGIFRGTDDFTMIYSYESRFQLHVKAIRFDTRGNIRDSLLIHQEREYLDNESFEYVLSSDRKKVLLYREDRYNSIECILFDLAAHQKSWHRTFVFDDYRISHELQGLLLTNAGELVLAFEKFNHSFRRGRHFQEIFLVDARGQDISGHKVDFRDQLSTSFNFEVDERNGEIVVAGLYAPKSISRSEGYYLYKLNGNGMVQNLQFEPFSTELLRLHAGKRKSAKNYISDLFVKDLVIRNDGGLVILAEMQKEVARESVRRRYIDYHYEDMLVISIHPDGTLFWDDLIRKYQLSYDDLAMFSSYFLFRNPSRLRIIFNDEIKSENTVSEYSFSPISKGQRSSLLSTDLHQLRLLFDKGIQISPNAFLVPSMAGNSYRIIRIAF